MKQGSKKFTKTPEYADLQIYPPSEDIYQLERIWTQKILQK
jgi:hypothetical protein